jgi:hypothetical protein
MKNPRKIAKYNSNTLRIKILSDLKEASRILSNLPNGELAKESVAHIDAAILLIESYATPNDCP